MIIVDDYAHHPAEIKATIDGARQKYLTKKLLLSSSHIHLHEQLP